MAYNKKDKDKLKAEIIEEISNGRSLKNILDYDNKMPKRITVYRWLNSASDYYDEEFCNNYVRATRERAEYIFDEMLSIADTTEEGKMITESDKGTYEKTGDMLGHRTLKVNTRKWILSRMNPKKYGEASLLKIANNDGEELKINAIFSKDIMNVPTNRSTEEDTETN